MQTNNFSCATCRSACESHKKKKNIVYNRQNCFLFLNYSMATFHAVWAKEAFKMQRKPQVFIFKPQVLNFFEKMDVEEMDYTNSWVIFCNLKSNRFV